MKGNRYRHRKHSKGILQVHLIFVTRFRKKLLAGDLGNACKQALFESASRHGCCIAEMEADKDHVHMLVEYPPTIDVSTIAKYMKQKSTHMLWKNYNTHLRKEYWDGNTFWSKGFFYCSIGEVSALTIRHYIQNQG